MNVQTRFLLSKAVLLPVMSMLFFPLASCGGSVTTPPASSPTSAASATSPAQATTEPQLPAGATPAGPQDSGTTVPANIQAPVATGYLIKVFFSRFPESGSNFGAVFAVDRVSPTIMVGTFGHLAI